MLGTCKTKLNQKDKFSKLIDFKIKKQKKETIKQVLILYTWTLSFTEISEILQCPLSLNGIAGMNSQELKITMSALSLLFCAVIDMNAFFFLFKNTLLIAHVCVYSQCPSLSRNFAAVRIYWDCSQRF